MQWRRPTPTFRTVEGFTPDQRFFIGFAQWACENQRPEQLRMNAVTDPHSPGDGRINGIVTNMPQFAAAFQCAKNAPMVKAQRLQGVVMHCCGGRFSARPLDVHGARNDVDAP